VDTLLCAAWSSSASATLDPCSTSASAPSRRASAKALSISLRGLVGTTPLHRDHRPRRIAALGDAPRHAHQVFALAAAIDRHQHAPAQRQGAFATGRTHLAQAAVHAVGGFLHGQLAQGGQVGGGEVGLQRLRCLFRYIDLALLEPRDQLARWQVDQHDVMQAVQHAIGHGLADADAGDPQHLVIEAFQVLDVDRRPDVDPCIQQLHHILPAPLVAAARRIAMRQFIHQHQRGAPLHDGIQVHLFELPVAVGNLPAFNHRQALQQGLGFGTPVGFDHADHQVHATAQLLLRAGQHGVGLADARRGAEEHGQPPPGVTLQAFDEGVGLSAAGIGHAGDCAPAGRRMASPRMGGLLQRPVEFHHVDPRLAQHPPLRALDMRLHDGLQLRFGQPACLRYAAQLHLHGRR
jgi:hypothetical protein